jgi:DNA repair protein RadC
LRTKKEQESINASLFVYPKLRMGCYIAIVISHNHPSGDPTPSPEDVAVTRQLVEAGKVLDIELVDHLVIGNHRFVSLKERMRW